MSDDLIYGLAFMLVVVPVVMGVLSDMYKRRLAFRERELELLSKQTAEKAAQYAAQAERLEQRVRVLERIATENNSDLALRIEQLRTAKIN
ncbi:MAG: hypothetical protein B7Y36_11520 [Novosphingobium sp. 28-62-57]|uniref:hypothetical protein n=1 Tax=unclassified Novosphingobium TaxID=2644732 RepID=UPI000BDB71F6|nr:MULTISPECIES: hypothetical protein [unclassified Novosphingobium]OYW50859.1 MAG: hypothetical protein B7Z34_03315 [Novosphingobium sp. 12-62-10]OYZ10003.1 MAG: hypothetical protein B7Y36_11520 [Novosphingobium sp. 28-62-57]OYZ99041.1 MAG: hypothetical protein B7X96_00240 [Novosphingobium sp. 17-62-8]HQS70584.1 hypothetical protein [Novosphingobium sp.]